MSTQVLAFDGTLQGLAEEIERVQKTMPHSVLFVHNPAGDILNRLRLRGKMLSDGSFVWDVELFGAR